VVALVNAHETSLMKSGWNIDFFSSNERDFIIAIEL